MTLVALQSQTYGEAARVWSRYAKLVCEVDELAIVSAPNNCSAVIYRHGLSANLARFLSEHYAAMAVAYGRQLLGDAFRVSFASFAYPAPPHAEQYATELGCPVRFSASRTCITIENSIFHRRLPAPDSTTQRTLVEVAESKLRATAHRSWRAKCESALRKALCLEQRSAKAHVAKMLGVSPRTLQRRLQQEGVTFRALREAVLKEAAKSYLQQPLSIAETALLLGYEEPSSFQHAFRRWFGCRPSEMRRVSLDIPGGPD